MRGPAPRRHVAADLPRTGAGDCHLGPVTRWLRRFDGALFAACLLYLAARTYAAGHHPALPDDLQVYKGAIDAWRAGDGL